MTGEILDFFGGRFGGRNDRKIQRIRHVNDGTFYQRLQAGRVRQISSSASRHVSVSSAVFPSPKEKRSVPWG